MIIIATMSNVEMKNTFVNKTVLAKTGNNLLTQDTVFQLLTHNKQIREGVNTCSVHIFGNPI